MTAKVENLKKLAQKYKEKSEAAFDPLKAGVLQPLSAVHGGAAVAVAHDVCAEAEEDEVVRARKRTRLYDKHGSFTLREMRAEKERRKEEIESAAQAKAQRKLAVAARKSDSDVVEAARLQGFALCEKQCACGAPPFECPYAKWKRCPRCGPKPSLCKVRACVEARKGAGSSDLA
jgi:hypothetical protein